MEGYDYVNVIKSRFADIKLCSNKKTCMHPKELERSSFLLPSLQTLRVVSSCIIKSSIFLPYFRRFSAHMWDYKWTSCTRISFKRNPDKIYMFCVTWGSSQDFSLSFIEEKDTRTILFLVISTWKFHNKPSNDPWLCTFINDNFFCSDCEINDVIELVKDEKLADKLYSETLRVLKLDAIKM